MLRITKRRTRLKRAIFRVSGVASTSVEEINCEIQPISVLSPVVTTTPEPAPKGVFAMPSIVAVDVRRQYKVEELGETSEIVERCYAISVERRVQHPAVAAICDTARAQLFG